MKDETKPRGSFLDQFIPAATEPAEDQGLPALKEGEYQPHSRPSNKPLYTLHFITPDGNVRSFQYVHLGSDSQYSAEKITLNFMGIEPLKVILQGTSLWRLYDYLHQHRIAWVTQAARPFAANGETVIDRITVSRVTSDRP